MGLYFKCCTGAEKPAFGPTALPSQVVSCFFLYSVPFLGTTMYPTLNNAVPFLEQKTILYPRSESMSRSVYSTLTMSRFSSDKAASSFRLAAGCHSFPCSPINLTSFRLAAKQESGECPIWNTTLSVWNQRQSFFSLRSAMIS